MELIHRSPDGLTIYFASSRSGGSGTKDLWYAGRTDRGQPFPPPRPLSSINTSDAAESEPWIHSSTCELFFVSNRQGGPGGGDIYRTRFVTP